MSEREVILVTGVAGYWGSRVAARLAAEGSCHVIGLDAEQPAGERNGLDFVLADVRNPLLVELLKAEKVDTVCHLAFQHSTRRSEAAFDANVIGTTKLLGACAEAGVWKVVLKSSTAVYGARPTNSAFLDRGPPAAGQQALWLPARPSEIGRNSATAFAAGCPRCLTTLRFCQHRRADRRHANDAIPAERHGRPSMMGFNPMMQIIHENDVVAALLHAV